MIYLISISSRHQPLRPSVNLLGNEAAAAALSTVDDTIVPISLHNSYKCFHFLRIWTCLGLSSMSHLPHTEPEDLRGIIVA